MCNSATFNDDGHVSGQKTGAGTLSRETPSICFVAHNAYGALSGTDTGHTGGIEWQQALMARWLAKEGYRVDMVTWDEGQPAEVVVDGVRIRKMCRRDDGIPVVRLLHPRWTSLYRAIRQADADIYYYNCGDMGLGQVSLWCRYRGRKCVYSVASNPDCDPRLPKLTAMRERLLYRYGLRHADCVITQTRHQQQMLRHGFGLDSVVIPMPCEGRGEITSIAQKQLEKTTARVLWVGRISKEKRLEWLLDLAERTPQMTFDVAGAANTETEYASALRRRADGIPNVAMHGRVARREMLRLYGRAVALCCTSAYEGFPNTFLEAWSRGLPVVSTFDPDGLIERYKLGFVADSVDGLAAHLRELVSRRDVWCAASKAAREYYLANHTVEASMARFEHVFLELVSSIAEAAPVPRLQRQDR